jgi:DNA-binding transcriptional LysR family regulator
MALNLHLVRLFVAVAEQHSFSRAAAALHISQPAVSKGVHVLERQLGLTLLDRSQGDLPLTDAGRTLYEHALGIFASESLAESALAQIRGLERGRLTIGASTTVGIYRMPALIAAFQRDHPAIQVALVVGNTRDLVPQLVGTPLDLAVVEGHVDAAGIQALPWRQDRLIVIAPPNHPARHRRAIVPAALEEDLFLLRERGSGTRETIDARLDRLGIALPHIMEVSNTEAIKQMVAAGIGLGIVPDVTCRDELATGRLIALDAPDLVVPRQAWRLDVIGRPLSPAAQQFLLYLDRAPS